MSTTENQAEQFQKLNLPSGTGSFKYYKHVSGKYAALLMVNPPMFNKEDYVMIGPMYTLDEILKILTHYYKVTIVVMGKNYQVSCDHANVGRSAGLGKTIAEAAGWLLLALISHDKFFTPEVRNKVIGYYIKR